MKAVILSYDAGNESEVFINENLKQTRAGDSKEAEVKFTFRSRSVQKFKTKQKPRLLHVEDVSQIRLLVSVYLKQLYDVKSIEHADQIFDLIESETYDAFLIDINLGGDLDGFDIIKKIRAMDRYKKTPVVVLTVFEYETVRDRILASKVNAYLQKPFQKELFLKTIEMVKEMS